MKNKNIIIIGLILLLAINLLFVVGISQPPKSYNENTEVSSSSLGYNGLLNNIFNYKIGYYGTQGYFAQIYQPSIQATYYALEILETLGRLNEINTAQITNFIMSFYQPNQSIFLILM